MKKKLSNSELEVLALLNDINGASPTSTFEQISSNSKRILEKAKNDSKTESNKTIPDADVSADDETSAITESVPNDYIVAVDETTTENAKIVSDTDDAVVDTAATFEENKINILKSKPLAKCAVGKHPDNTVKSFATFRVKIDSSIKWITMCETCLIDFLKLAQRCYVDDNFTDIKSQDNDKIEMSISIVNDDSKCPFCPKGHVRRYRIKVKKKSFVVCRGCLFKLINKIVSFLYYNSSNEVIESIAQFFNENDIPFKNIFIFTPYRNKKSNVNENNNSLEQDTVSVVKDKQDASDEVSNEPAISDDINNELVIPDDINLEDAKKLLFKYQKKIIKRDNNIENLTEAVAKRDQTIKNLNNYMKLIIEKSNNRRIDITHKIKTIDKLNKKITQLTKSNEDLVKQLHEKDTAISELQKKLFPLEYSLDAAYETIEKLSVQNKTANCNSVNKPLKIIRACKEIIDFIK